MIVSRSPLTLAATGFGPTGLWHQAPRNCRNPATLLYKSITSGGEAGEVRRRRFVNIPHRFGRPPMTTVGQAATVELAATAPAAPGRLARVLGLVAVALALLSAVATFSGAAESHADPADPRGRARAPAVQCGHDVAAGRRSSPGRSGVWCRRAGAGRAGSRLHVRIVALFSIIAAVPADPGGGGRERHARSRARPAVLAADASADGEFADRGGGLFARTGADRARRHHRDRDRARAAPSRSSTRTASSSTSSSTSRPRSADCRRSRCSTVTPSRRSSRPTIEVRTSFILPLARGARLPSARRSRRSACSSTTIMSPA